MTGGAQTPVTNANKIFYLNLLAQYRLASQVKEEVEHFLKGGTLSPSAEDVSVVMVAGLALTWILLFQA